MELCEDEAMLSYLECCENARNHFVYSRHLQMVELHVHLLYPKLWRTLGDNLLLFLQLGARSVSHREHALLGSRLF